jgi:hypothetical protein
MLPILPALLLLILQGPSSIEKMALDGRLPAALEAVSRRMEAQDHRSGSIEKADAAVLASLLALSNDPDLSKALFCLLALDAPLDAPAVSLGIAEEPSREPRSLPIDSDAPRVPDGWFENQRSRDGPF